jgi:hypothetical protein
MSKNLVLVDFENRPKVDLSVLDDSYRAIVFVGANQNPPKAARKKETAYRFERVDFLKIEGNGRNALDFHIAFQLGRILETAPETHCFILSADTGFDPLITHLTKNGLLSCRRIESLAELVMHKPTEDLVTQQAAIYNAPDTVLVVCDRCHKASTIEHHGGRWCTNCGRFASPPDPERLPSRKKGYREPNVGERELRKPVIGTCSACRFHGDMSDGHWDDGEWVCGGCLYG